MYFTTIKILSCNKWLEIKFKKKMLILLSFFSLIHIINYSPNFVLLASENLQFNASLFCFMIANANGAAATSDCDVPFQAATSNNEVNIDQNNLPELLSVMGTINLSVLKR